MLTLVSSQKKKAAAKKAAAAAKAKAKGKTTAVVLASSTKYSGRGTFYTQDGNAGSCGSYNSDSALIVALNSPQIASFGSNKCGSHVTITNTANGRSVRAVIADTCPSCSYGSLDLSLGAYDKVRSSHPVLPSSQASTADFFFHLHSSGPATLVFFPSPGVSLEPSCHYRDRAPVLLGEQAIQSGCCRVFEIGCSFSCCHKSLCDRDIASENLDLRKLALLVDSRLLFTSHHTIYTSKSISSSSSEST